MPLAALVFLPGCVSLGGGGADSAPVASANGPAADYPVVLGEPFTIGALTYTPEDTLNYDAVGYASLSDVPETKVSAAHKTLPLPSYAEVTNLDTGRTILVRVETRGPMVNSRLIELSQGAAIQLGIGPGANPPVRVRRVNPPEVERAVLRAGGEAPARMETPDALLKVLRRKLADQEPLSAPPVQNPPEPAVYTPPSADTPQPVTTNPEPAPEPVSEPTQPQQGDFVVQVAAFSSQARADRAAEALGGFVTKPGAYWYVRLGPFASPAEAGPALEQARKAGYSDARIQRSR